MIILQTIWDILKAVFITSLTLTILYYIGEFFNWIEYKRFEKDMNDYLEREHEKEWWEKHDYEMHQQYMMREWNW